MGYMDKIGTAGFCEMSDRQAAIRETGGLGNLKTIVLDQAAGMPFWSDNNVLLVRFPPLSSCN